MEGQLEYAVRTLQTTNTELQSSYPAAIEGKQDIEIRPQVGGFITKLGVDEGDVVRKGQTLFVIDPVQSGCSTGRGFCESSTGSCGYGSTHR